MKKEFFTTECIVLRHIPYRETSSLVYTLTHDHGKVDLVVKGCHPSGGKKGNSKMDPPRLFREYLLEYSPGKSRSGSSLHTPSTFELLRLHDGIGKKMASYLQACRFAAFLLKNTREEQELPETFSALSRLLGLLGGEEELMENGTLPAEGKEEFFTDLAFFVYLNENGLLPEMPKEEDARLFSALLEFAVTPGMPLVVLPEDYPSRLHLYLYKLLAYHNLTEK